MIYSSKGKKKVIISEPRNARRQDPQLGRFLTSLRAAAAARPDFVCVLPIRIRSGLRNFSIAVPSARNSWLKRILNGTPGL